ncbi:ankyrin repeat domain-containing protein 27-like [Littorina saxatilis]|uniref:VPS9 domain-containing protein n=1 Tax=Littorina saxatilis TaxID=31220 RepID=A0AAN9GQS9_9CAEN
MANYDEDLYENPFFLTIHKQFTALFNKAVAEKALVCIPKYSSCTQQSITEADIKDHILFPGTDVLNGEEDEENNLYKTLSGKVVLIEDGQVHTKPGFEHQQSVRLLFEETFHSENDNSYRVLCIEHFINRLPATRKGSVKRDDHPSTYSQCLDLLWNHSGGQKTRDNLDKMMTAFCDVYDSLEGESLRSIQDMAGAHFTKAMQLLLKDSVVRRSVKHNPAYMESLKIAVETYLTNAVHKNLFRVLTALMASEDAEINKMTRNLASLQLQDLGIRKIFSQNIPPAKKELAGLNSFSTPMGRLFCVKRVVTALTRPLKQKGKMDDNSTAMMTTDDFLPILIFLIIKSEIPNWMANLTYMRHFHLAKSTDDDEFGFYLASVEAALEHIKSGYISEDMKINKPKREGWSFLELSPGHSAATDTETQLERQDSSAATDQFFMNVQEGNEEAVKQMLQRPQRTSEEVYLKLCHPLCSCDKCEKVVSASRNDSDLVTTYTRDNKGYTALHMAAYYGQGQLIDLLIQSGAVVDATDYLGLTPLHLACQRGYQKDMLLLLHFGADVMCKDNDGNTPLHHCCYNGHEDCVKALVFSDSTIRRLEVNTMNEHGDTALHMAAKWGYESIVKTLLENGANATIKNRKRQSPIHVAQNVIVQRLLQHSVDGLELQPVSSFVSTASGSIKGKGSWSSSSSSSDLVRQESLSLHSSADGEEAAPSRVETASLDEAQDKQLKSRKDKLFKAIMAGDIQLVKFYLGIKELGYDQLEEEEELSPSPSNVSLGDMCHPLCQCHKCLSIQKAQVRAHQALSVNVKTTSGYTPLHMAVLHGQDDMVQLFLERGAHVSTQNHKNMTPLHIAACLRKLLTMHLLVEHGAKLNVRDINGDSPLLICSASGFHEGVQLLLQKGADVNTYNHRGNTALHEAADHSHRSIVTALLEAGADPTIRNKQTKTAFNMARDTLLERELQRAVATWQEKHQKLQPDTRQRSSSQRVVGRSQVSVQQLFAAFEEDDLKTLQSLTAAIRGFDKQHSLKKAVTRDNTYTFLNKLVHQKSIQSFDQTSLRHISPEDKSRPMYIYSLATPGNSGGAEGGRVEKDAEEESEERGKGEREREKNIEKREKDLVGRTDRTEKERTREREEVEIRQETSRGTVKAESVRGERTEEKVSGDPVQSCKEEKKAEPTKDIFVAGWQAGTDSVDLSSISVAAKRSDAETEQSSAQSLQQTQTTHYLLSPLTREVTHHQEDYETVGVCSPADEHIFEPRSAGSAVAESSQNSEGASCSANSGIAEEAEKGGHNECHSNSESVSSTISDIFEAETNVDKIGAKEMISSQLSSASEVSDIFESADTPRTNNND